eukprot:15185714-Alexandrium_andersonii.AAC.1
MRRWATGELSRAQESSGELLRASGELQESFRRAQESLRRVPENSGELKRALGTPCTVGPQASSGELRGALE